MKNYKEGYYLNPKYDQDFFFKKKREVSDLSPELYQILFGMILGNASVYLKGKNALIKFEQSYKNRIFLEHLFNLFKDYVHMEEPGIRLNDDNTIIKGFWFKTFPFYSFTSFWHLCYEGDRKTIAPGVLKISLTARGLAYWIMCDGCLEGKTMYINTAKFKKEEVEIISQELNEIFGFTSIVKKYKEKYWIIKIPYNNFNRLYYLINPYIIPSLRYKIK